MKSGTALAMSLSPLTLTDGTPGLLLMSSPGQKRINKQLCGCMKVNLGPFEGVEVDGIKFPFLITRISVQKM